MPKGKFKLFSNLKMEYFNRLSIIQGYILKNFQMGEA